MIIPFALEQTPEWLQTTGCQILLPGQYITYLVCRFGVGKAEAERAKDLRSKIQRKLSNWAGRFLTWISRVLLLQHVLLAIPVYHFLGLGLHRTSYKRLEAPCRVFLWGTNADNNTKTPLVSWESITKLKKNRGLQVRPFQRVSEVMKMKYARRLMNGEQSNWAQMMRWFIRQQMQKRSTIRETKLWTIEEGLLLLPSLLKPQSETTNNIIRSRFRCRKYLRLAEDTLVLPGNLTLRQIEELL
ncbi:hypothetical protein R1flu_023174 [Riccia fluitans]|uniref:Uncharacterized protein n=1 Tax=Riccia fluitans TaxID=41844 RepID=A0ABD1XR99_9MARC